MKRTLSLLLAALLLLGALAGCGSPPARDADLTAFYQSLAEKYGWDDNSMTDLTGDLLESCYPGLSDIAAAQLVAKAPMISIAVNEIVLIQCENADDAARAAEIFRQRVKAQAEGGAWYPESMAAWAKAQVLTQGSYAAMIACAQDQSEIADAWAALFR